MCYPFESNGRVIAISQQNDQMPEEVTLDYAEITSIPPLPLWTLLEADKEMLAAQNEEKKVS